jgi:acetylornithine deacetylase/succinyl-diaminopimelate desuccinylase-like protein
LPSVTVASRGLVALEVTVEGAAKDLHSARHGGSVPNPMRALTQILADLRMAMGATIPIGEVFARNLGVGTIFFSFSTSDEDYHAPNEHFRLSSFRTGRIAWARPFERLAAA